MINSNINIVVLKRVKQAVGPRQFRNKIDYTLDSIGLSDLQNDGLGVCRAQNDDAIYKLQSDNLVATHIYNLTS